MPALRQVAVTALGPEGADNVNGKLVSDTVNAPLTTGSNCTRYG